MNAASLPLSARSGVLRNGLFGVGEYLVQPLSLALAAPYLMRHLGAAQFGIWVLAGAAVNSGNLLSSSFGDATIRYVAVHRGRGDTAGIAQAVGATLLINFTLSGIAALALWLLAPAIAVRVVHDDLVLRLTCTQSLRIGSALLMVRSLDSVLGCTLRAFERYAPAVSIATCFRFGALAIAVWMSALGNGVARIMNATLGLAIAAALADWIAVRAVAGRLPLLSHAGMGQLKRIWAFGSFSWLQAVSAVAFGQADRLIVGMTLGAPAVAMYGLCAQIAQAIHGTIAAGLHVLFPHFSRRVETEPIGRLRNAVRTAVRVNVGAALVVGGALAVFSRSILTHWMGPVFAQQAWPSFSILAIAFALFAMNVTAHYTLLALGSVRVVTGINLISGLTMITLMVLLASRFGMVGIASARLVGGPLTCLLYLVLAKQMREPGKPARATAIGALENA